MDDRFIVKPFDGKTFVVIDTKHQMEMCVCGTYEGEKNCAKDRAESIALSLNLANMAVNKLEKEREN